MESCKQLPPTLQKKKKRKQNVDAVDFWKSEIRNKSNQVATDAFIVFW